MPSLEKNNSGHFGFSAVNIKELGSTEYTLVTIVVDNSGSTRPFSKDMEQCIQKIIESCSLSPRSDNLLVRVIKFSSNTEEIHGFNLLSQINVADYDNCLQPYGSTALVDACVNSVEATALFAKQLRAKHYEVNGVIFIVTDGEDNDSSLSTKILNKINTDIQTNEDLDSLVTVLIGIEDPSRPNLKNLLDKFSNESGITTFEWLGVVTPNKLAKLGQFISKSISTQSSSIGNGPTKLGSLTI